MKKMCKFGKYNKLYKYIFFYLICKFIYSYLFTSKFPEKIKILKINSLPKDILVQVTFDYLGILIFSLILYKYQIKANKKPKIKKENLPNPLNLTNSENNSSNISSGRLSSEIELIYNDNTENNEIHIISFISTIMILILSNVLNESFNNIGFYEFDYWMFEILFIALLNSILFKAEIYSHQKVAIIFILIFSTSLLIISNILLLNEEKDKIYIDYTWIIPILIVSFLIIDFMKDYSYCKIKWFLDFKYISPVKVLIWFGFFGTIFTFILSIISSFIKCGYEDSFNYIDSICQIYKKDSNGKTIYYYDNFSIYFENLWRKDRKNTSNFFYIILILFRISICFLKELFSILIIQKLNPIFYICSISIFYFFSESVKHITNYIEKENFKKYEIFTNLAELFNILGTIYYLELIEFTFCGLSYNVKNNILIRSMEESNIELNEGEIEDYDEEKENEDNKSLTTN